MALLLVIHNQAFSADAEDAFRSDSGMTWPMLPNESIGELAIKFYPHNAAMQQRFTAKTLQLNKQNLPELDQKTRFTASTAILIPNLKSLASGTKAIKFRGKKQKRQSLHLSYNIQSTLETLPKALNDEYEQLLARNEVLKTEIAKLDERLLLLQNKLTYLRQILEKIIDFEKSNTAPAPTSVAMQKSIQPATVAPQAASSKKPASSGQTGQEKPVSPAIAKPATSQPLASQPLASQPIIAESVTPVPVAPLPVPPAAIKNEAAKPPTVKQPASQKPITAENADPDHTDFELAGLTLPEWIMALAGLLLAVFGIQYLSRKRQQRAIAFLTADSIMPKPIKIGQTLGGLSVPNIDAELATAFNTSTQVDEYKERSILEEAKLLVKNNAPEEAIGHLKWALRAQPKTAIGVWLYLLAQLRAQNMKEDFERYAFELHQNFNVMTPLWVNHTFTDMVVAESVEAFGHIKSEITKTWPTEQCKHYLQTLIADNRNGERSGFSQEVIDEVLFLIELQDTRLQLDELQADD